MGGKKGMKKYSEEIKKEVCARQIKGEPVSVLSREYGISRWAIQNWCGLVRKEEKIAKQTVRKPAKTLAEYKYENKRLKMENELLRDFLSLTGRK